LMCALEHRFHGGNLQRQLHDVIIISFFLLILYFYMVDYYSHEIVFQFPNNEKGRGGRENT